MNDMLKGVWGRGQRPELVGGGLSIRERMQIVKWVEARGRLAAAPEGMNKHPNSGFPDLVQSFG